MKKTKISEAKLQANQKNATLSTGPKQRKEQSSRNSYKHGFFAKILQFETEEEQQEYRRLEADLHEDLSSLGVMEELLVARAATLLWNQRKIEAFIQVQLQRFTSPQLAEQIKRFVRESALPDTAVFGLQEVPNAGSQAPPWEIRELLLRVGNEDNDREDEPWKEEKRDKCYIEARLGPSIDILLRCRSMVERSLEKTLNQLEKLQARRRGVIL